MSGTVRIKVSARTNKHGSDDWTCADILRSDWEGMTEEQREELARECLWELIEWDWEEVSHHE